MHGTFQGALNTPEPTPQPTPEQMMTRYGAPQAPPSSGLAEVYRRLILALGAGTGAAQPDLRGGKVINYPPEVVQPAAAIGPRA